MGLSGDHVADPALLALTEEYVALRARVTEARDRAERLRALADHVEEQAARDEHALKELEGVLGMDAQLRLESLDRELGGRRLREIAIDVLGREVQPGQPVHYRHWFALLRAAGYRVRGKDPLASFLAQISRAPDIEAVGQRSGLYRVRTAA